MNKTNYRDKNWKKKYKLIGLKKKQNILQEQKLQKRQLIGTKIIRMKIQRQKKNTNLHGLKSYLNLSRSQIKQASRSSLSSWAYFDNTKPQLYLTPIFMH